MREVVRAAVAVGVGRAVDLGREGPEAGLVGVDLGGEGQGQQRAPVEAVLERDHRRPAGGGARDLDRVLHRLRAGVHEHRLLREGARHERVQPLGQAHVALVGRDVEAAVGEARRAARGRAHHPARAWPTFRQPMPPAKSSSRLPSTSTRTAPFASSTKIGVALNGPRGTAASRRAMSARERGPGSSVFRADGAHRAGGGAVTSSRARSRRRPRACGRRPSGCAAPRPSTARRSTGPAG